MIKLIEFAKPQARHLNKTYYHGTSNETAGKQILQDGFIKPGELSINDYSTRPVEGKVYITDNIEYATIYAIGGVFMGTSHKAEGKGYIFSIDGKELKDIQPDEDAVGEMVSNKDPEWLYNYARKFLDEYEMENYHNFPDDIKETSEDYGMTLFQMVMDGDYASWAYAGKILLEDLDDDDKLWLLKDGVAIAHGGKLDIKNAWEINLNDIPKIDKDASNIFNIAKKIR